MRVPEMLTMLEKAEDFVAHCADPTRTLAQKKAMARALRETNNFLTSLKIALEDKFTGDTNNGKPPHAG